tara:strand:+ start:917 stop:1822 length:906 start_codon:yes stop_codon:yes gene_type:complete
MSDGQTYYDGLIQQGYPAEQALSYTQQYYAGFTPVSVAPMPIPTPQPIQPMIQQPVQQMTQPMMNTVPMAVAPIGEPKPIMAWAAVGCIAAALILCMMGQFGNSWQVAKDDDSLSLGLSNIVLDCSEQQDEEECISTTYILFAEDIEKAAEETPPSDPVVKGDIENYCENSYELVLAFATAMNNSTLRNEAGDDRETCLKNDSAGGITGLILWIGILGIIASTVMLVMSMLGQTLPGGAESYGRISSWVSGGLILFAAILWMIMKNDFDDDLSTGMSFYLALFAGLFAVGAGVLDLLDKRE